MSDLRAGPGSHTVVTLDERVELYDTDASGLIFFGAASRWATSAEFRLFEAIGHRIAFGPGTGTATPVRAASFEYLGPLALGTRLELRAWIDEVGRTSLSVVVEVRPSGTDDVKVRVRLDHVHVRLADMAPEPLPDLFGAAARRRR